MGRLCDGTWFVRDRDAERCHRHERADSGFRSALSSDGSTPFPAEPGRYVLYASVACPWTHRVLLVRGLRGLTDAIDVVWAEAFMGEQGWTFARDPYNGVSHAWQLYALARPDFSGRATVPVLWDTVGRTIVSTQSLDLVRCLDQACDAFATRGERLWPDALDAPLRAMIEANRGPVNSGVYRVQGTDGAVDRAALDALFARLHALDRHLADHRWLLGDRPTAADVCLFPTLVRFDAVYRPLFGCDVERLADLPNLWDWTRAFHQLPGVAETVDLEHARRHYATSRDPMDPDRPVPSEPLPDFTAPTRRGPA